jgi:hypothetical protein
MTHTISINGVIQEYTTRQIAEIVGCLWMGQNEGVDEPSTYKLVNELENLLPDGWNKRGYVWPDDERETKPS